MITGTLCNNASQECNAVDQAMQQVAKILKLQLGYFAG